MNDIFSELVQEITSKNKDNRRNSDKNDKDDLPIKSQINCAIKQNTQEEINDISEKVKYGYREIIKEMNSGFSSVRVKKENLTTITNILHFLCIVNFVEIIVED